MFLKMKTFPPPLRHHNLTLEQNEAGSLSSIHSFHYSTIFISARLTVRQHIRISFISRLIFLLLLRYNQKLSLASNLPDPALSPKLFTSIRVSSWYASILGFGFPIGLFSKTFPSIWLLVCGDMPYFQYALPTLLCGIMLIGRQTEWYLRVPNSPHISMKMRVVNIKLTPAYE